MPVPDNLLDAAQKLAQSNNDNAAVLRAYRLIKQLRQPPAVRSPELEKKLDDLDWLTAEREARPVRAVGFFLPEQAQGQA